MGLLNLPNGFLSSNLLKHQLASHLAMLLFLTYIMIPFNTASGMSPTISKCGINSTPYYRMTPFHLLYNFCKGRKNYTNRTLRCSVRCQSYGSGYPM